MVAVRAIAVAMMIWGLPATTNADAQTCGSVYRSAQSGRVWYGLPSASTDFPSPVLAELLITAENATDSNVGFRYGPDFFRPGQEGLDSIAGFAAGDDHLPSTGRYGPDTPNFVEFRNGAFVGDLVTGAVPEQATWLQLIPGVPPPRRGAAE